MLAEKSAAGETRQRNLNHHAEGLILQFAWSDADEFHTHYTPQYNEPTFFKFFKDVPHCYRHNEKFQQLLQFFL
jgi:hypothetical protein